MPYFKFKKDTNIIEICIIEENEWLRCQSDHSGLITIKQVEAKQCFDTYLTRVNTVNEIKKFDAKGEIEEMFSLIQRLPNLLKKEEEARTIYEECVMGLFAERAYISVCNGAEPS